MWVRVWKRVSTWESLAALIARGNAERGGSARETSARSAAPRTLTCAQTSKRKRILPLSQQVGVSPLSPRSSVAGMPGTRAAGAAGGRLGGRTNSSASAAGCAARTYCETQTTRPSAFPLSDKVHIGGTTPFSNVTFLPTTHLLQICNGSLNGSRSRKC